MGKKAMEISPPSLIVVVILVLLVVVILLFIFGGQSSDFVNIINGWKGDISNRYKCENILLGRYCDDIECGEGYQPREIPPPPGEDDEGKRGWDCTPCYECVPSS